MLPRLQKLLSNTLWAVGLMAVGFALGHHAHTVLGGRSNNRSGVNPSEPQ